MPDAPTMAQLNGTDAPTESVSDSLRAALLEGGAGASQLYDFQGMTPEGGAGTDTAPVTQGAPEGSQPTHGVPRGPDGRFVSTEESQESPTPSPTEVEVEPATPSSEEATGETEPEPLDPPALWSLEHQNEFRSLDPKAQQFVLDRIGENQPNPLTQTVESIIQPRLEDWNRRGFTPEMALNQLLALSDLASQDPGNFVTYFMEQAGLTPEDIWEIEQPAPMTPQPSIGETEEGDTVYSDPRIAQLQQQIQGLQDQLAQTTQGVNQRISSEEQQREQQVLNEINQFRTAQDDSGKPAHPYFDEVKTLMGNMMSAGSAPTLQDAYDMACRAHPQVSAKIAAAVKAAEDRQRQKEEREAAKKAEQAGTTVTGSPSSSAAAVTEPTGDLREDLRAAFAAGGLIDSPVI